MARKFEEIPVWLKTRELCKRIYFLTRRKPFCYDHGLVDQITQEYISEKESEDLSNAAQEISYQLSNWIKSMQTTDAPAGPKYNKEKNKTDKFYENNRKLFEEKLKHDGF